MWDIYKIKRTMALIYMKASGGRRKSMQVESVL